MQDHQVVSFCFHDQQIRTIRDQQREPWFVAKDVCDVLGLSNVSMALEKVPDKHKGVNPIDTLRGTQMLLTVNEAGMYRLILRSDKPQAEPFMEWVTSEVLPTIRKTGRYLHAGSTGPLTGDQLAEVGNAARNAAAIVKSYGYGLNRVKSRELVNTMIAEATGVDVLARFHASGLLGPDGEERRRQKQQELLTRFAGRWLRPNKRSSVPFRSIYKRLRLWSDDKVSIDCPLPSGKALAAWLDNAGYSRRKIGGTALVYGCELLEQEVN